MHFLSKQASLENLQTLFIGKNINPKVLYRASEFDLIRLTPQKTSGNVSGEHRIIIIVFPVHCKNMDIEDTLQGPNTSLHFTWHMKRLRFQIVHATNCLLFFSKIKKLYIVNKTIKFKVQGDRAGIINTGNSQTLYPVLGFHWRLQTCPPMSTRPQHELPLATRNTAITN